jgi:hypothetical protein
MLRFLLTRISSVAPKRLGKVSVLTNMMKYDTIYQYGHYVCYIEHL